MKITNRFAFAAALLLSAHTAFAQTRLDPSGHWEGTIDAPFGAMAIEVDLTRNEKGELSGTYGQAREGIRGLPFTSVTMVNDVVAFAIESKGGGRFQGIMTADGSMTGEVSTEAGSAPFTLTRKGAARIEAPPKNPPIARELEGTWNGTLDVNGGVLRVVVRMSNEPDGTSKGVMISVDEGGLTIPLGIVQKGAALTLDAKMIGGTYSGTLSPAGSELAGTYTTRQGIALPLTLKRSTM